MKRSRVSARKPGAPTHDLRRRLEALEDRTVPAALSIAGATAIEGDNMVRFTDDFVSAGSGGVQSPRFIAFGPDGKLYVASKDSNEVLRYDGATGAFIDSVIPSGSGLVSPLALDFGPDGNLYVGGLGSNDVFRYNLSTGTATEFVPAGSGGLMFPKGLTFGPDGNLYVSSADDGPTSTAPDEVLRYNGQTGAFMGVFVTNGSGGLDNPSGLEFGPDGNLYVSNTRGNSVNRYSGVTGAFMNTFVAPGSGGLATPVEMTFRDGKLLVAGQSTNAVLEYDATTGAYLGSISGGGLNQPDGFDFDAAGNIYVGSSGSNQVLRYGPASEAAFAVSLDAAATSPVTVNFATADGTAHAGSDYVATSGTLTFAPGQTSRTILVPTVNDNVPEPTETFTVTLSNPTGATIAVGKATGTIKDDDATQFFVVDAAAPARDYQYGLLGAANGSTALADTAPRGAASTAAGTKVWVADANQKVYVYNAAGGLLGSWTALDLPRNSAVEGIATNGTDVWVLVNGTSKDQVYKYTGAASRLSGSQGAVSSFRLNSADTNPMGIVTDGTSFWVVDDGTSADKVFKYTLAGGSLGSWTIDPANSHPTGLTIDPTNVSDIWVVDNGTDKVYQYTAAAGLTSGSQTASATFALAPGDTNPQDIADPPPAAWRLPTESAAPAEPTRHAEPAPARSAWLAAVDLADALTAADPLGIGPIIVGMRRW